MIYRVPTQRQLSSQLHDKPERDYLGWSKPCPRPLTQFPYAPMNTYVPTSFPLHKHNVDPGNTNTTARQSQKTSTSTSIIRQLNRSRDISTEHETNHRTDYICTNRLFGPPNNCRMAPYQPPKVESTTDEEYKK